MELKILKIKLILINIPLEAQIAAISDDIFILIMIFKTE